MQFTKLKVSGFKSFIDSTELVIQPGVTGVVGPNGCGKSNIVEAIRWVMGETSAKQMRGGGMEDVIFNGTDTRSARNVAEVALVLDNGDHTAPAAFNGDDQIEVARRIERGGGSSYVVNGQEVRARDVPLLPPPLATGAHPTALVGQGRVNDIVNAKPTQRRGLLEEAAGITGLHARRHEAELRLKGAESNLARLQDVVGALEAQLNGLKRQSRQASRYRRVSENLRRFEALLFHQRWSEARNEIAEAERRLESANAQVSEMTRKVAIASTAQAEAAEKLPDLRQHEAECAAALHRLAVARDTLEEEERQVAELRQDLQTRLEQIAADLAREDALSTDARAALARVEETRSELTANVEGDASAEQDAGTALEQARNSVAAVEDRLTRLTEEIARKEARHGDLRRRFDECSERLDRLNHQKAEAERERSALAERAQENRELIEAEQALSRERGGLEDARRRLREAEQLRDNAQASETEARDGLQVAEARLARLLAEESTISDILGQADPSLGPAVVDGLRVEPGYEAALGAALGDDLEASENEAAAIHWTALGPLADATALPNGTEPLDRYVHGPRALERRLAQIGVVKDAVQGNALRAKLALGQRLVSLDGAMWRWDGLTVSAEAQTPAANRLRQRNRLTKLETELPAAERDRSEAQSRLETNASERTAAAQAAEAARTEAEQADERLNDARDRHQALATKAAADVSRLGTLEETLERINADLERAETDHAETQTALDGSASADDDRAQVRQLREELGELRARYDECARTHERLTREAAERDQRLVELDQESDTWRERAKGADQRLAELTTRQRQSREQLANLDQRPAEIGERRRSLLNEIVAMEEKRNRAADALAQAEDALATRDRALKEAERSLASAREERVRDEGRREQARQAEASVSAQVRERLQCEPEETLELAEMKDGEEVPNIQAVEARLDRLVRERDNIGPVNLRAEAEVTELEQQIGAMIEERTDLEAAIARLREGIGSLNREGRERVMAAFGKIDGFFQGLFTHLFGGGHAHLELVESDDPLEAGLEIMASPPGKRLQSLSLLSGGEKTLTALALLFAAFQTNPAPICILDEVDAPLDDSNVDRFCNLISEIVRQTGTRFIVVTHHRMTMSRVDRLFGVTMAERGVSQIVSVDMAEAEQWRESA